MRWPNKSIQQFYDKYSSDNSPIGIVIIDLDFFIRICLRFDTDEIETILQNIYAFIRKNLPEYCGLWRSDGDELIILYPGIEKDELLLVISDIKKNFKKEKFASNSSRYYSNIPMAFSAGIAGYPEDGSTLTDLMRKACTALFMAKAYRRNKVIAAPKHDTPGKERKLFNPNLDISVIIGKHGEIGYAVDSEIPSKVRLWEPQAIDCDELGNLYIVDQNNHSILMYDGEKVCRIAGNGLYGYRGDGGKAVEACLNKPTGLAVYKNSLYITDTGNDVVRRVDLNTGVITTVAGNGEAGYSGDGGKAVLSRLNKPGGVAVDSEGIIYINDIANNVIRKVDTKDIISTYAGTGEYGYDGDGNVATSATFNEIYGIFVDRTSNDMYIADYFNHCIRKIDNRTKIICTVVGNGISGYDGDDPLKANLDRPVAVYVDYNRNIYVCESGNNSVRYLSSKENKLYTLVGDGVCGTGDSGHVSDFRLSNPNGLAMYHNNLYVIDGANNRICLIKI